MVTVADFAQAPLMVSTLVELLREGAVCWQKAIGIL
jgi:hypothetical protein